MDSWIIYVHYRNHFTNGQLKTYGSEIVLENVHEKGGLLSSYEVTPIEVTFLDRDDDHCFNQEDEKNSGNVDLWAGLENFIASQMNCTLPWLLKNGTMELPLCSYPNEYLTYRTAFRNMIYFDTDYISKKLNCTPSCKRVEYAIKPFTEYQYQIPQNLLDQNAWVFEIFFAKDRFPIREQYYTYDFQNLLADFGGYLGLLLGYSLLGFYDIGTELVEQVFDKCNKDRPNDKK